MIHLYTGKEVSRNTKTACGVLLERLSRTDASVPYQRRASVECEPCRRAAEHIARMRHEN
jgi:hypothetical protein